MNSSSVNVSSLAASKCICRERKNVWWIYRGKTLVRGAFSHSYVPFVSSECQSVWAVSWIPRWAVLSVFLAVCFQQVAFLCSGVPRLSCPCKTILKTEVRIWAGANVCGTWGIKHAEIQPFVTSELLCAVGSLWMFRMTGPSFTNT